MPQKILIIRPGALGDTLMLMPSIAALGASTEILFVGRFPGLTYIKRYVRRTLDYEGQGWHTLFQEDPGDYRGPSMPPSDLAVAFLSDPEGTVKRNLSKLLSVSGVHVFPPFPKKETSIHASLYIARCLEKAGMPIVPEVCLSRAIERPLLGGEPMDPRRAETVFHPGSGSQSKNHPPVFWLKLIKEWRHYFGEGQGLSLLLGPAEEPIYSYFEKHLSKASANIIFSPEPSELISHLSRACLYVGHDSGVTHLAAMLGTPAIALFKNSNVDQWRPLGPRVRIIEGREGDADLFMKVIRAGQALAASCG